MKTSVERIEEFTSGALEETAASIKASGKVMMSLVRNLYTNPVRAAIRETIQNHLDEHYRLGLEKPIEIHVPTIFDPTWRTRDFGESMSSEFMLANKGGYMEIGHSTRERDVRQAGAWGYGKLAALAYTDQCSVRCIQEHRYRLYIVKLKTTDEPDGSYDTQPVISLVDEGATPEPDGTEVGWAVAFKDVRRFQSELSLVLAGMFDKTMPIVIEGGHPTHQFDPGFEVLQSGKDWRLVKEGLLTRAYARVLNVMYPLDASALPTLTDAVRNLLSTPLIVDFTPMEVHIPPSRDGLEYSDKTVTAVEAKLTAICDELVSEVQAEISACPSRWDAIRLFQDRLKGQTRIMATLYVTAIKYKDRALPKGQVGIPKWLTEEEHRVQVRFTTVEAIRAGMLPRAMSKGQLLRNRPLVDPHGEFLIYVQHADDRKLKYSAERLLNDLASRPGSIQVLWIRGTRADPELQRLLDHYGLPADRVKLIGSLPLPAGFVAQKSIGGGRGGRSGPTIVRGLQRMHRRTQAIKLSIGGPSEIVYLPIGEDAKLWARIGTRSMDTWEIDRLIAAYRKYTSDEREVVLLRPKELVKVQGKTGWFEISDLMRTWLKTNVPDQALLQHSAAYSFVQSDRVARFLLRNETFFAPYPKVKDAIQLCQSVAKPADDAEKTKDGAKVFSEFVGLVPPAASGPATATIVDQIEAFKSEYPVLAYVAEHGSSWGPMSHTEQVVLHHYLALA